MQLADRVFDLSGRNVHDELGKLVWIAGTLRHESSVPRGRSARKGTQFACRKKFKLRHYPPAARCFMSRLIHGFFTPLDSAMVKETSALHHHDSRTIIVVPMNLRRRHVGAACMILGFSSKWKCGIRCSTK